MKPYLCKMTFIAFLLITLCISGAKARGLDVIENSVMFQNEILQLSDIQQVSVQAWEWQGVDRMHGLAAAESVMQAWGARYHIEWWDEHLFILSGTTNRLPISEQGKVNIQIAVRFMGQSDVTQMQMGIPALPPESY